MHAYDIDGTLLNYGAAPGSTPIVNQGLINEIGRRGEPIAIVTNQGGLVYGMMGVAQFPTPAQFVERLKHLIDALPVPVSVMYVSVYHSNAPADKVAKVADQLHQLLLPLFVDTATEFYVWSTPSSRKPEPLMLQMLGNFGTYSGDGDEDKTAAYRAAWEFVRVPRFTGE